MCRLFLLPKCRLQLNNQLNGIWFCDDLFFGEWMKQHRPDTLQKYKGRCSLSIHVFKAYFRLLSPYPYISLHHFKPNLPRCKPWFTVMNLLIFCKLIHNVVYPIVYVSPVLWYDAATIFNMEKHNCPHPVYASKTPDTRFPNWAILPKNFQFHTSFRHLTLK